MTRRWTWIASLLALLLTACAGDSPARQTSATGTEVAAAFVGDLEAGATATGKVLPQRTAALSVETPGRVEQLFVRVGDPVAAGDTLLQLESDNLDLSLASARQELAVAEANLSDLGSPPLEAEIAAAEAALASAQAQLDALHAGPRPEEVASVEASVRAAEAGVWSSSAQLGQTRETVTASQLATARANLAAAQLQLQQAQLVNTDNPNIDTHNAMLDAQEQVAIAQAQLDALLAGPDPNAVGAGQAGVGAAAAQRDAAQANLDILLRPASEAQIAQVEANLAQAEATVASLKEGPSAAELRIAQAQLEQAQLAVAEAEERLDAATVRAPFAARVTALHVQEGEVAAGVVAELMDMDSLRVVLAVDEADIGRLEVGQPAVITLDARPDDAIKGEVVRIAPTANADALVSYEVHLGLSDTDLPVLAGMTANARLVTAQREDVLLVPNRAIIADRASGAYSVDLLVSTEGEAEEIRRVEVTIGLRDDENTQITSGLEAGDRLLIAGLVAENTFGPGGDGPTAGGPFGGD